MFDSVANRPLIVSPSGEKAMAGVMTRIAASAVAAKATFCRTLDQKNSMARAIAQLPQAARTSDSNRPISEKTIDPQRIITSDEAIHLPSVPKSLVIMGSGAVGVEFVEQRVALEHDAADAAAYAAIIAAYAAAHPDRPWVHGSGWAMDRFPGGTPHRRDLDALVPDRPAFLSNRDGHGAWVNSRALELAGVTASTPDPFDGRIERDPDGSPSGTLHEGAMHLVDRLIPKITRAQWDEGLLAGQRYLHAFGITGWQDAIVGGSYDSLDSYIEATRRGTLTAHVVAALWWDRNRGMEQIPEFVERRERAAAVGFRATSIKIMQDGVLENFTAALVDPYLDGDGNPTDNSGISFVDPALLVEAVPELDRLGFQVHVHALADRAVREGLDAIEEARRRNGMNDLRHHIAHIQVVHPDDVPRFRALGVHANMQPLWATLEDQMTDLTIPFLGEERTRWQYPFRTLLDAGAESQGVGGENRSSALTL